MAMTEIAPDLIWEMQNSKSYQKKNLALGNLAKLKFWLMLLFKNLQQLKVYIFLSFSGER